ncbi:hypothetical protein Q9966_010347 [Columba livia]|nr:hypothetical protein Q9966_010347 [Columba livia]
MLAEEPSTSTGECQGRFFWTGVELKVDDIDIATFSFTLYFLVSIITLDRVEEESLVAKIQCERTPKWLGPFGHSADQQDEGVTPPLAIPRSQDSNTV